MTLFKTLIEDKKERTEAEIRLDSFFRLFYASSACAKDSSRN